jgi:hypothetical protein
VSGIGKLRRGPREGRSAAANAQADQTPHRSSKIKGRRPTFAAPRAGAAYLAFKVSIRILAAGPDEAGFWPVIRSLSLTVWTPQFLTLE